MNEQHQQPLRIVIAGSRTLGQGQAERLVGNILKSLPKDCEIHLRRGIHTDPGCFESETAAIWRQHGGAGVFWHVPDPAPDHALGSGRASVYRRDIEMVETADLVLLFFSEGEDANGYSGTAHLLDCAFMTDRMVYAFSVSADGKLARIGETP